MTDIFESLARDHRDVEKLFARYAETGDDAIAHDICDALTIHTEVEEHALYPELRRIVDDGDDMANVAEAEHAAARVLIARIYETPPIDLRPLVDELRATVEHHVAAEESDLFPRLRESGADAEALGRKADAARGEVPSRSSGQVG
jgi:hemerythrin superfamily protein